jgi:CO dehydrogenase nickel-insertion accessory protein CooC1
VRLTNDLYQRARIKGLACALNEVADRESGKTLRELSTAEGLDCSAVIPYDAEVSSAWLRGGAVVSIRATAACDPLVDRLELSGAALRAVTG